jgi:hypothetical protein
VVELKDTLAVHYKMLFFCVKTYVKLQFSLLLVGTSGNCSTTKHLPRMETIT